MKNNEGRQQEWDETTTKYKDRLNDEHYSQLDKQMKIDHTYEVDEIPCKIGWIYLGNGNYRKAKFTRNE